MRVVAIAGFVLLSGTSAVAQYTAPNTTPSPQSFGVSCMESVQPLNGKNPKGSPASTCTSTAPVHSCPMDMHVRQGIGGGMIAVDEKGVKRRVYAPRLRLFLNDLRKDRSGQKIVSATVTVHGTSGKPRMQNLNAHGEQDADLNSGSVKRTMNVELAHWGDPGVSGDFVLPGFTSASRVDLESVTYEEGTTWKLSGADSCRVAPDPLMLINH